MITKLEYFDGIIDLSSVIAKRAILVSVSLYSLAPGHSAHCLECGWISQLSLHGVIWFSNSGSSSVNYISDSWWFTALGDCFPICTHILSNWSVLMGEHRVTVPIEILLKSGIVMWRNSKSIHWTCISMNQLDFFLLTFLNLVLRLAVSSSVHVMFHAAIYFFSNRFAFVLLY